MGEPTQLPTKHERIEALADMMAAGTYRTRITARDLAPKWGVSYRTIENDACEASRLLSISPERREAKRAEVAARYEAIAADALARTSIVTGLPDYASAIRALAEYAKLSAIDSAPEQTERPAPPAIQIIYAHPEPKPTE